MKGVSITQHVSESTNGVPEMGNMWSVIDNAIMETIRSLEIEDTTKANSSDSSEFFYATQQEVDPNLQDSIIQKEIILGLETTEGFDLLLSHQYEKFQQPSSITYFVHGVDLV